MLECNHLYPHIKWKAKRLTFDFCYLVNKKHSRANDDQCSVNNKALLGKFYKKVNWSQYLISHRDRGIGKSKQSLIHSSTAEWREVRCEVAFQRAAKAVRT